MTKLKMLKKLANFFYFTSFICKMYNNCIKQKNVLIQAIARSKLKK